jgi:hypothetical protein
MSEHGTLGRRRWKLFLFSRHHKKQQPGSRHHKKQQPVIRIAHPFNKP